MRDKGNRRLLHASGVVGLLVVTIFGALSQAGILVPRFRLSGTGGGETSASTVVSNTLENVSPRSWKVTSIHLTNQGSTLTLPDVHIIRLGLQRQDPEPSANFPGTMQQRLTVAPGQYFNANLVEKQSDCPSQVTVHSQAEALRLAKSARNHQHSIPAVLTVSTPLGTRTVGTTFTINCGL